MTSACTHEHTHHTSACRYTDTELELAAKMLRAMSDPARLRLLLWLQEGERCVTELVILEHAKASSISARLQLLYSSRLVTRRRDAKHVFYNLADEHVAELLQNVLSHATEPNHRPVE